MKKKIISLLSALALTAQIVPCALAGNDVKVYVNDTEMVTDAPIIIENNRTLAPVRAILEYLDYNVDWDGDAQKVVITKNNTEVELHIGDDTFFVDGILQSTDTAPQIINDLTYVPLAVIAQAFLCQVDWDGDKYEVHITPPYEYEKDNFAPLIQCGIISENDLTKDGYITTQEVINTISRLCFSRISENSLNEWYNYDCLKPLDNIDDTQKISLLHLNSATILTLNDIIGLKFEDNLTNLQALTYAVRLADSYKTLYSQNFELTDASKSDIYNAAYQHGFIENEDTSNANLPILRKDFYELLNKVLFYSYYNPSIFSSRSTKTNLYRRLVYTS